MGRIGSVGVGKIPEVVGIILSTCCVDNTRAFNLTMDLGKGEHYYEE